MTPQITINAQEPTPAPQPPLEICRPAFPALLIPSSLTSCFGAVPSLQATPPHPPLRKGRKTINVQGAIPVEFHKKKLAFRLPPTTLCRATRAVVKKTTPHGQTKGTKGSTYYEERQHCASPKFFLDVILLGLLVFHLRFSMILQNYNFPEDRLTECYKRS